MKSPIGDDGLTAGERMVRDLNIPVGPDLARDLLNEVASLRRELAELELAVEETTGLAAHCTRAADALSAMKQQFIELRDENRELRRDRSDKASASFRFAVHLSEHAIGLRDEVAAHRLQRAALAAVRGNDWKEQLSK